MAGHPLHDPVRALHLAMEPHLRRLEKLLPEEYRLTLVARNVGSRHTDADIVLTRDELPEVIAAVERLHQRDLSKATPLAN